MTIGPDEPWSPARNPYAIAVSEAWWALQGAALFASDATSAVGPAQQIYGRAIFGQLRALRRCADMQARELRRLKVDSQAVKQLDEETQAFDASVPGVKEGRDILEHFDEYARGEGFLQKAAMRTGDVDQFEVATAYSVGGYDATNQELTQGPFVIRVPGALHAAARLQNAIYEAGRAVDRHGAR